MLNWKRRENKTPVRYAEQGFNMWMRSGDRRYVRWHLKDHACCIETYGAKTLKIILLALTAREYEMRF
jgi:hypothetical protein